MTTQLLVPFLANILVIRREEKLETSNEEIQPLLRHVHRCVSRSQARSIPSIPRASAASVRSESTNLPVNHSVVSIHAIIKFKYSHGGQSQRCQPESVLRTNDADLTVTVRVTDGGPPSQCQCRSHRDGGWPGHGPRAGGRRVRVGGALSGDGRAT